MSRFPLAQPTPPQPTIEGDSEFIGVNMKEDRGTLPRGIAAEAINKRMANKVAEKRPGTLMPAFANIVEFASIVGSGIYSNPRGNRQLLIAVSPDPENPGGSPIGPFSAVYRITSGGYPTMITVPADIILEEPCYFVQVFDKVLLLRGTEEKPLIWNGKSTGNFQVITKKDPAVTDTILLPNVARGVEFKSRLIAVHDRTNAYLSDISDPTSVDPILADFPLNLGTSDAIVRLFPYVQGSMVVGKENRLELLTGFNDPNHPELARLEVLNADLGTCSWDSWVMVGGDLYFMSKPGGVFNISQVLQDRLETNPVPVSDPIEPLIKRINWAYSDKIVAGIDGFYAGWALPLDGSTYNNCIIWFNTVSKQWEGRDRYASGSGMRIDNLLRFDYNGARRLYAINHGTKSIHLLNEGKFDNTPNGRFEIADRLETRGYATLGWNAATRRDFRRAEVSIGTNRPSITTMELTDRASDVRSLTSAPVTKNRKKWINWGQVDYVLNNANADHEAPNREDYSIDLDETDALGGIYLE